MDTVSCPTTWLLSSTSSTAVTQRHGDNEQQSGDTAAELSKETDRSADFGAKQKIQEEVLFVGEKKICNLLQIFKIFIKAGI